MKFIEKMFKKAQIKSTTRGFSIVSALLGFSLLGLSTVGLATYMGSFEQVKLTYDQQSEAYYRHKSLLENARKVITAVKSEIPNDSNSPDIRDEGMCRLVNSSISFSDIKATNKKYGPVKMSGNDILNSATNGITQARWDYFIESSGGWVSATGACDPNQNGFVTSFTEDSFNRCYSVESSGLKYYARVSITPLKLPEFNPVQSGANKDILVDHIVFRIDSLISSPVFHQAEGGGEIRWILSKNKELVWVATEIAECDVCDNPLPVAPAKGCKIVSLSSGLSMGSKVGWSNIFYHSPYEQPDMCQSVNVVHAYKSVIQQGISILASDSVLQTDTNANVAMSCTANLFICKHMPAADRFRPEHFDPVIRATLNIEVDNIAKTNVDSIGVAITDGSTTFLHDTLMTSAEQKTYIVQKGSTVEDFSSSSSSDTQCISGCGTDSTCIENCEKKWYLFPGGNEFLMRVKNETGGSSICMNVCQASPQTPKYYPKLDMKWNSRDGTSCTKTVSLDSSHAATDARIACTVCHSKSCHRFGLGTFGKKINQPVEPIDANIPECTGGGSIDSYELDSSGALDVTKKCMVLSGSELVPTDCADTSIENTVCFINGEATIVPKTVTLGTSLDLGTQADACFRASIEQLRLGNETTRGLLANMAVAYLIPPSISSVGGGSPPPVTIKESLDAAGLKLDSSGKSYEIYNSANQGVFMPLSTSSPDDAWVNIERDHSGMLVAGLPFISDVVMSTNRAVEDSKRIGWAFFFREPFQTISYVDAQSTTTVPAGETQSTFLSRARPTRPMFINLKYTGSTGMNPDFPNAQANPTTDKKRKRLLLTHHIHYKGLRIVDKSQTNSYPSICVNQSTGDVTITPTESNSFSYPSCGGGDFIPPTTPKQWTEAFLKVAPTAPRYPFPNPFNFEDGSPFTNNVHDYKEDVFKYAYRDLSRKADFTDSKATDNFFVINSANIRNSGSGSVLSPVRSAWIGLEPKKTRKPGGTVEYSDPNKQIFDWMINLEELLNLPSASLFVISTAATSDVVDAFIKMNDLDDAIWSSDWDFGSVDHEGVKMSFKNFFQKPNDLNSSIYSKVTKPCRIEKEEVNYKYHLAPFFKGNGSDWLPTCDDENHQGVDTDDIADMVDKDVEKMRSSVQAALILKKELHDTGKIAVFNQEKFCQQWKREKERRAKGRCVINAFNSGFSFSGVNYGYSETIDCRRDERDLECDKGPGILTTYQNRKQDDEDHTENAYDNAQADLDALASCEADRSCSSRSATTRRRCRTDTDGNRVCRTITIRTAAVNRARCRDGCTSDRNGARDRRDTALDRYNMDRAENRCAQAIVFDRNECENTLLPNGGPGSRGYITYIYNEIRGPFTEGGQRVTSCDLKLAEANYNTAVSGRQCHDLDLLNPHALTQDINGKGNGNVGIVGRDSGTEQFWTNDESCWTVIDNDSLIQVNSNCKNSEYIDLIDIVDDDLCDDSGIDDQSCTVEL